MVLSLTDVTAESVGIAEHHPVVVVGVYSKIGLVVGVDFNARRALNSDRRRTLSVH